MDFIIAILVVDACGIDGWLALVLLGRLFGYFTVDMWVCVADSLVCLCLFGVLVLVWLIHSCCILLIEICFWFGLWCGCWFLVVW